ncbi:MAG TPA: single-stranded-DNA-specific exonuclease RecJ [Fimbriimonadaceae bacterium]|nr:single-stranded-DNA-specific exonuclease RecJ [Fimbriimonadaceae bacterium]
MSTVSPPLSLWNVRERNSEAESRLQRELGIGPLLAPMLVGRGYDEPAAATKFLHPSLDDLHPGSLLPDFDAAVGEILAAKERGDRIFVHGDYDVDGVTSAALFTRFLRTLKCDVVVHVPHRMREGYGIHQDAVQSARESGAKLFLTCDCGANAHDQVLAAHEAGMRVVVTDHHEVGETLPEAEAIVNPHRRDSVYPFPELAGVGVVFKVCEGITRALAHPVHAFHRAFLDLVALGTVADVMPLIDENRVFVRHGLPLILGSKKPGIQALLDVSECRFASMDELKAWHIGFRLGPRLNAAGRIDDAALALDLLMQADPAEAKDVAAKLDVLNEERRAEQNRILDEAIEIVEGQGLAESPILIVAGEGWHSGIIGIVAGKLAERYHRPTFVMHLDRERGTVKGSARSIPAFHLADALQAHRSMLLSGGGHAAAAGCAVTVEQFEGWRESMLQYAAEVLDADDLVPRWDIDAIVEPAEVTARTVDELARLEPFGSGNRTPMFAAHGLILTEIKTTKSPDHVMPIFRDARGRVIRTKGFGLGERFQDVAIGATVDVVFTPELEEYQGERYLKWNLKDFVVR